MNNNIQLIEVKNQNQNQNAEVGSIPPEFIREIVFYGVRWSIYYTGNQPEDTQEYFQTPGVFLVMDGLFQCVGETLNDPAVQQAILKKLRKNNPPPRKEGGNKQDPRSDGDEGEVRLTASDFSRAKKYKKRYLAAEKEIESWKAKYTHSQKLYARARARVHALKKSINRSSITFKGNKFSGVIGDK